MSFSPPARSPNPLDGYGDHSAAGEERERQRKTMKRKEKVGAKTPPNKFLVMAL